MRLAADQMQAVAGWASFSSLGSLAILTAMSVVVYRLCLHPLRHVPGPLLGRTTSLFLYGISYLGIEGHVLRHYHYVYNTKVLRVSPNSVSISDNEAIHSIYVAGGGFLKDSRYVNFNLGQVVTIFSSLNTDYRDIRAKAVAPLFSPSRLRTACEPQGVIRESISEFVSQFKAIKAECKSQQVKCDILDLCARLSLDVVTGYLLGEPYGGLQEHQHLPMEARRTAKLSINPFIFAIVAFSRFSLLPNQVFQLVYSISSRISFSEAVGKCFIQLDTFTKRLVQKAISAEPSKSKGSYQDRLLAAGIAPDEVEVQCKAIIFASSDSTAVKLATILFHLVQNQDRLRRLRDEIFTEGNPGKAVDSQPLPYLRAVVKEGLRVGMANPTRMTRVVPSKGLQVGDIYVPPGTIVGAAAYVLHHDPDVFPEPLSFRPERWLESGMDDGLKRPGMEKSLLMFGAGLRACIGKNLAQQQLLEAVKAVVESGVLEDASTCQDRIQLVEWFNAEIKGHVLEVDWS
jgi:cytochrome P450